MVHPINVKAIRLCLDDIKRYKSSICVKYRSFSNTIHWHFLVLEQAVDTESLGECIEIISLFAQRSVLDQKF